MIRDAHDVAWDAGIGVKEWKPGAHLRKGFLTSSDNDRFQRIIGLVSSDRYWDRGITRRGF